MSVPQELDDWYLQRLEALEYQYYVAKHITFEEFRNQIQELEEEYHAKLGEASTPDPSPEERSV